MPGLDLDDVSLVSCEGFGLVVRATGSLADTSTRLRIAGTEQLRSSMTGTVAFESAASAPTLPPGTHAGNANNDVFIGDATTGAGDL